MKTGDKLTVAISKRQSPSFAAAETTALGLLQQTHRFTFAVEAKQEKATEFEFTVRAVASTTTKGGAA
jgi:hypothetical protein